MIASDVVYSHSVVEPLFDAVHGLLSDGGSNGSWGGGGGGGERRGEAGGEGKKKADDGCLAVIEQQQQQQQPYSSLEGGDVGGGGGSVATEVTATAPVTVAARRRQGGAGAGLFPSPSDGAITDNGRAVTANFYAAPGVDGCEDIGGGCGRSSTSSGATTINSRGAVGPPLFVMSQSFGYDSETESAIDRACSGRGFVREVVWDELGDAPPGPHQPQQVVSPAAAAAAAAEQSFGRSGGGVVEEGGGDGSSCGGGLPLSQRWRAGTKLQLFWRT